MKNKLLPIVFLLLCTIALVPFFLVQRSLVKSQQLYNDIIEECLSNEDISSSKKCQFYANYEPISYDMLTFFNQSISSRIFDIFLYLSPFLIMLCSIWTVFKKYQSGYVKNYVLRNKYTKYLKEMFQTAYKAVWIIPVIIIICFILSYLFTKSFDFSKIINSHIATFDEQYLKQPFWFMVSYVLNKVFFSIFYVNLALCFMKKNKSIIVTVLEAYLCFIGIEIINEVLISSIIFYNGFHVNIQYVLYILDSYSYARVFSANIYLLVSFVYAFVSFIIVLFLYKNKEQVIHSYELIKGDGLNEN